MKLDAEDTGEIGGGEWSSDKKLLGGSEACRTPHQCVEVNAAPVRGLMTHREVEEPRTACLPAGTAAYAPTTKRV